MIIDAAALRVNLHTHTMTYVRTIYYVLSIIHTIAVSVSVSYGIQIHENTAAAVHMYIIHRY